MSQPSTAGVRSVADRLSAFGSTIFTEISRLAIEHDAINLGQGFPNFDGPDFVKQAAINAIKDGHGQYARMFGIAELNRAIAARFNADAGLGVDPDAEVTITSGCTEALIATFRGLVNPEEEVILFEPYYDSYRACVAMSETVQKFLTLRPPLFGVNDAGLPAAVSPNKRATLFDTHHNPSG